MTKKSRLRLPSKKSLTSLPRKMLSNARVSAPRRGTCAIRRRPRLDAWKPRARARQRTAARPGDVSALDISSARTGTSFASQSPDSVPLETLARAFALSRDVTEAPTPRTRTPRRRVDTASSVDGFHSAYRSIGQPLRGESQHHASFEHLIRDSAVSATVASIHGGMLLHGLLSVSSC